MFFFGGLARHDAVTADGFMGVICHEIGHHLGGYPHRTSWASNEGQSDYYATTKCLKAVWKGQESSKVLQKMYDNIEVLEALESVDLSSFHYAVERCKESFQSKGKARVALCARSAMGGLSLARLFASGGGVLPSIEKKSSHKVARTYHAHPEAQCRFDTYFAGSLCRKEFKGEVGQVDKRDGFCHRNEEKAEYREHARPRCWYKPSGFPLSEEPF